MSGIIEWNVRNSREGNKILEVEAGGRDDRAGEDEVKRVSVSERRLKEGGKKGERGCTENTLINKGSILKVIQR